MEDYLLEARNKKTVVLKFEMTDIPFTVLSFTAATGDVVMCGISMKTIDNVDQYNRHQYHKTIKKS